MLTNEMTEKYLLALRCLLASSRLDPSHPKVHTQTIQLKQALNTDLSSVDPEVAPILTSEFTLLPANTALAQFNNEYMSKHKNDARRTLAGLEVRKLLADDLAPKADADVVGVLSIDGVKMEEAVEGLELLKAWKSSEVEAFKSAAEKKWPKATVFASS